MALGELCEIELGRTPARAQSRYWDKERISGNVWLSIADLLNADGRVVSDSSEYISNAGAMISKLVRKGTLLVSFKLTLGRLAFAGRDLYTNEAIAALSIKDRSITNDYLYWFLHYFDWEKAAEGDQKVKGKTLNKAKLQVLPVLVPPLAEQKRIVGILDEAFAAIATAKANTEKNLANARAVFESFLESVFAQHPDWERVSLQGLLDRGWIADHMDGNHGSDYPRKEEFIDHGVPYISANCIDDDRVNMAQAKYLSPERAAKLRKGFAKNKDVLFAHNATVGPVAILRTDLPQVILGTSLTYYRCEQSRILPEYLSHYMRSAGFTSQYTQIMRQSTRNQVPITKQREFLHVVPPLADQRRIVSQLDGLFDCGSSLVAIYGRKLSALDALKKSLLHRAFTGQLTASAAERLLSGATA